MTFVNERISQEDREKHGVDKRFNTWCADRERNIFLVRNGLSKEAFTDFILYFDNKIFRMSGQWAPYNGKSSGVINEVWYEMLRLPESLTKSGNMMEVLQIFKEALSFSEVLKTRLSDGTIEVVVRPVRLTFPYDNINEMS